MSVKHPLTVGLITVLTVALVVPLVVYAESRYDTRANSDIVAGVIGTTGDGASYDILSGNFFTFDKNFGQNLYQFTYERARSQGSDMAVEKTLTRLNETALSSDAIRALVPGSNISQLLTAEEKLDPTKVFERKAQLENTLAEEKEFADLQVAMLADVEPTELFANGDESDSGFDLLVDLDVIETILFGKSEAILGDGSGANGERAGNVVDVRVQDPKKKPTAREKAEQKQKEQQEKKRAKALADAAAAVEAAANPKPINPADEILCPIEPSFNSAAEAALTAINDVGDTSGGAGSNGAGANANAGGNAAGANNNGGDDADGDGILDTIEDANKSFPEKVADWSRELPCDDLFCLTIVPKFKTESSYVSSDNCIACHVEKINDAFAKTLKHNLVPNKVTGNLYEGPKCKKALLSLFGGDILSFNFIPIAQPILTPPNDNLIIKGDFVKNLVDAYKKYYNNPGRCANGDAQGAGGACASDGRDSSPAADVAKQTLGSINQGTDIASVLTTLQGEVESRTQEAQKIVEESRLNSEAQAHASQYGALMSELDAMNASFQAMKDTLLRISDPKDTKSPCAALINKPVCE